MVNGYRRVAKIGQSGAAVAADLAARRLAAGDHAYDFVIVRLCRIRAAKRERERHPAIHRRRARSARLRRGSDAKN
jgi:hypothetical protein